MKKSRFSERQIAFILKQAQDGTTVEEVCRKPCPALFYPWDRIRKRAGLPDVRLHDLRHSYASFLVNNGVSIYVVQQLLGHTQTRTTQRYSHLDRDTLNGAAAVVGEVVKKAAGF